MTVRLHIWTCKTALVTAFVLSSVGSTGPFYALEPNTGLKATLNHGAQSTDWIDFELYRDRVILVPVKVNGHSTVARLLIGASSSLDKSFVEALNPVGEQTAAAHDASSADRISGLQLEVGALTVQGFAAPVKDLSAQATKLGRPFSVVLGDDALRGIIVDLDFPRHRLAFHNPQDMVKPEGAQELALLTVGVGYSVPVSVEGAKPAPFHLEFGNSSPLMVTRPYAQARNWLGRRSSQRYTGLNKEPEGMLTLKDVVFAGVHFSRMPAVVVPNSLFDAAWFDSDRLSGIVGMPLLVRYRLLFDFPNERLYALASAAATEDRLGLTLVNGQVVFVAPNSPAQLSGIKVGERIALIDDKSPEMLSDTETAALYQSAAGTSRTITMATGEVHHLRQAEYY